MLRSPVALLAAAVAALAVAAADARAQDPVKDAAQLKTLEGALRRSLGEKHLTAAKRLESRKLDSFDELVLGLVLDSDEKQIREKLGFKREGDAWVGEPQRPVRPGKEAAADKDLPERDKKQLETEHKENAQKLSALAKRAKAGGLADDARRLAGLALEESLDDKTANELLGRVKRDAAWLSAREAGIQTAFARALAKASAGEEKKSDPELEKLVGLGPLARRQSPHFVVTATKTAANVDLAALAKAAEASRAAARWFFDADDSGFTIEGATPPARADASRVGSATFVALIVDETEHAGFCERVVRDKTMVDHAKKLGGWDEQLRLSSGTIDLYETADGEDYRREWLANDAGAWAVSRHVLGTVPDFLDEGFRRFFGGHVTGRADMTYSGEGSQGNGREGEEGSFKELRLRARRALRASGGGRLRSLFAKTTGDLDRDDSAMALAFVDFGLAVHRGELLGLLRDGKTDELAVVTAERVFGKKIDELERELQSWVQQEY